MSRGWQTTKDDMALTKKIVEMAEQGMQLLDVVWTFNGSAGTKAKNEEGKKVKLFETTVSAPGCDAFALYPPEGFPFVAQ